MLRHSSEVKRTRKKTHLMVEVGRGRQESRLSKRLLGDGEGLPFAKSEDRVAVGGGEQRFAAAGGEHLAFADSAEHREVVRQRPFVGRISCTMLLAHSRLARSRASRARWQHWGRADRFPSARHLPVRRRAMRTVPGRILPVPRW
jgi:hypothetical protein